MVIRNTSGQFALWTGYNSGAANTVPTVFAERLRVDGNGNLLIGRTDSTVGQGVKLDVNGAINASALLVTGNVNFDSVSATKIVEPAANTLTFHTTQTERVRIDPTGNLLIGRTTSTVGLNTKLDVAGAVNASAVFANGSELSTTSKAIAMSIIFG
jgi:hypothetical protein